VVGAKCTSVFGGSRCHIAAPSDTAPAAVAFDAKTIITRRKLLLPSAGKIMASDNVYRQGRSSPRSCWARLHRAPAARIEGSANPASSKRAPARFGKDLA
jgi:hypothetical protein